jgi:hypothetical protein
MKNSGVMIYASSLLSCSVCAPAEMPIDEVERIVNEDRPAGTMRGWRKSSDATFASGSPNPCTCNTDEGRQHWLLDC